MNVFLERFRKFLEILCATLLIAITAVVFAQVVNRFVFHGTFAWAEEISIYMMVWLVFLGASINVLEESNIRIDFFVKLLPLRMQEFLEIICQLACAAFTVILCKNTWAIVKINLNNIAAGAKIPVAVLYSSLFFCAMLMILFFVIRAGVHISQVCRKGDVDR